MNKLIIALDDLSPEEAKQVILDILSQNPNTANRIIFKIHDLVSLI